MAWVGGMALGAGEGMIVGCPLEAKGANGIPLFRVSQALDAAGAALARGEALPAEASQGMARVPIPYMPRFIWHQLFMRGAASYWQAQAASHGLSKAGMLAAPTARRPGSQRGRRLRGPAGPLRTSAGLTARGAAPRRSKLKWAFLPPPPPCR